MEFKIKTGDKIKMAGELLAQSKALIELQKLEKLTENTYERIMIEANGEVTDELIEKCVDHVTAAARAKIASLEMTEMVHEVFPELRYFDFSIHKPSQEIYVGECIVDMLKGLKRGRKPGIEGFLAALKESIR